MQTLEVRGASLRDRRLISDVRAAVGTAAGLSALTIISPKTSTPYQVDYVFTRGVNVLRCEVLDDDRHWKHSDHCPTLIELGIGLDGPVKG